MSAIIKQLTRSDELFILQFLKNMDFIDTGSCRGVFEMPDQVFKYLYDKYGCPDGVEVKRNNIFDMPDMVIKLGYGGGGINQNILECYAYDQYKDDAILAPIYYKGGSIIIMEKVKLFEEASIMRTEGFDDYYEADDFISILREYYSPASFKLINLELLREAFDIGTTLNELFGYSSDNAQLGVDHKGQIVAYDYGYNQTTTSDVELVSGSWGENPMAYIDALVEYLENTCDGHKGDILTPGEAINTFNKVNDYQRCDVEDDYGLDIQSTFFTGLSREEAEGAEEEEED